MKAASTYGQAQNAGTQIHRRNAHKFPLASFCPEGSWKLSGDYEILKCKEASMDS
jgi:hypothetical protein